MIFQLHKNQDCKKKTVNAIDHYYNESLSLNIIEYFFSLNTYVKDNKLSEVFASWPKKGSRLLWRPEKDILNEISRVSRKM